MYSKLKIGLVGLDSSHCLAFTEILQDRGNEYHLRGSEIIGAYTGGSPEFALSRERVKGFTEEIRGRFGIPIYQNIPDLARDADALILLSSDGRQHFTQFSQMAVGKPVFIDKLLATTTIEAFQIIMHAQDTDTPILSCSSLRYASGISEPLPENFQLVSCEAFGPLPICLDYPSLFWYGIHNVEMLFSMLGAGVQEVRAISHPRMDLILGEWSDGRLGVVRGMRRGADIFGCILHGQGSMIYRMADDRPPPYYLLLRKVVEFFSERISPVSAEVSFAEIAFLEAATRSIAEGGRAVRVEALPSSSRTGVPRCHP